MKDKAITLLISYGHEEYKGPALRQIRKIKDIKEDVLVLEVDGIEAELLPAFTNSNFRHPFLTEDMTISGFNEPAMQALGFSFVSSMINNLPADNRKNILWNNLIKMGIKIDNPAFIMLNRRCASIRRPVLVGIADKYCSCSDTSSGYVYSVFFLVAFFCSGVCSIVSSI